MSLKSPKTKSPDNEKVFSFYIEQNSLKQAVNNDGLLLNKGAFDIVVKFSEPMGILVNASFNKKTYTESLKGTHIDKLEGFKNTGIAEGLLNADKEIFVSDKSPNYWYYDSDEDNRFNGIEKTIDGIVCKRSIENLFLLDKKNTIKISKVKKPLYLVLISYKRGENFMDRIEIQRHCLAINWKE
ncbi:MAG: hypothetical protein ACEQSR_06920 [Candidatus Methylacidiphilales bacterium]